MTTPDWLKVSRMIAGSGAITLALGGCQSYQPRPMDLPAHRASLAGRLTETEPLEVFADRLREEHASVPDRFDPSDGLSLPEGEVVALFYNPELRVMRAEAGIAMAAHETAGLWQDPEFGFDGAQILSGPFEFGLTLSLTIPVSGRLRVEKDRAGAAYEAELRKIADREWAVRADVRRAWTVWTAAREKAALLGEVAQQVERIGEITDRLESAGELSRVEARLFKMERADRGAGLVDARLEAERARLDLLARMGLPPETPVELLPAFWEEIGGSEGDDAIGRLIAANTELAVRRAEYRVAEETLRLEIREQYPDITIGGGYGREGGDDRLLLGLSIPLPILNANRSGIAQARARRGAARTAAEATFERLLHELASARAALDTAQNQREMYESDILPMLSLQSAEVEEIASLGEVDTLLLLETVTRRTNAKSRLIDLHRAETEARITITQLLGPTLTANHAHEGDQP